MEKYISKETKRPLHVVIFGLRVADRVKIVVAQFPATTFDELFEKYKSN